MATIKALDKSTIHQICSGQVIVSLANAVKELIENSLDAGAKSIEIRLKNFGADSIEVIDDGPGIEESEFQNISKSL
jgi:DNA mismatch repair protein PMS2